MKSSLVIWIMVLCGCGDANAIYERQYMSACPITHVATDRFYSSTSKQYEIVTCTNCDNGECDDAGPPCGAIGDKCEVNGFAGTCSPCCNDLVAELHCTVDH